MQSLIKELKLEDVAEVENSGVWGGEPDGNNADVLVIRTSDIDGQGRIRFDRLPRRKLTGRELARAECRRGDVLVVKSSGSHTNVVTGKACLVPELPENIAFTNFLLRLRPRPSLIEPSFLYYYLCSPRVLGTVRRMVSTTTYPNLRLAEYRALPVPVPPVVEQVRIVGRLQDLLARIEEVEMLQRQAAAEAEVLLFNLIDAQVDSSWPRVRIDELCRDIRNGWSGKQVQGGTAVGVLRLSCVHGLEVNAEDTKAAVVSVKAAAEFGIKRGDVFIVRGNGSKHLVGRSAIVCQDRDSVIFNDLLIKLAFKETAQPAFVNFVFHTRGVRRQIEELSKTAAGIWKINQTNLGRIEIPCPSIADQAKFVEKVTEARDATLSLLELSRAATAPVREAVLRQAFAGEL